MDTRDNSILNIVNLSKRKNFGGKSSSWFKSFSVLPRRISHLVGTNSLSSQYLIVLEMLYVFTSTARIEEQFYAILKPNIRTLDQTIFLAVSSESRLETK